MSHLSYNEITKLTGVSYRTIKKRLEGLTPAGHGKAGAELWESTEALRLIYQHEFKKSGKNGDGKKSNGLDYYDERALLLQEQRKGQELKNARQRGELIPAAEVKEIWGRIVTAAKIQFLALPARLTQLLETTDTADERRALIDIEVKRVLYVLAGAAAEKEKKQKKKPAKRTKTAKPKKKPAKKRPAAKKKTTTADRQTKINFN